MVRVENISFFLTYSFSKEIIFQKGANVNIVIGSRTSFYH